MDRTADQFAEGSIEGATRWYVARYGTLVVEGAGDLCDDVQLADEAEAIEEFNARVEAWGGSDEDEPAVADEATSDTADEDAHTITYVTPPKLNASILVVAVYSCDVYRSSPGTPSRVAKAGAAHAATKSATVPVEAVRT